ncbi:hypothetical protein VNO80_23499 [Phaseolus coccineus]|uniref:Uncharacterized protein n=1 Tax=Phaseolus coccineus TaxID=3886 RepID=A0AAN9M5T8_PHACN
MCLEMPKDELVYSDLPKHVDQQNYNQVWPPFFFKKNVSSEESDEETHCRAKVLAGSRLVETPTSAWSLENASTVFSTFQMRTSTRAWIPDATLKIRNTITFGL